MYQVLQDHLLSVQAGMDTLRGYPLIRTKGFLFLNQFSLLFRVKGCLLLLGLDMFFMMTRL